MTEGTMEGPARAETAEVKEQKATAAMSALDVLLKAKAVRQTEEIVIRQREGLPGDLTLTVGSLTDRDFKEISDQSEVAVSRKNRRAGGNAPQKETDGNLFLRLVVANGVVDPDFSNAQLLASQECFTPDQLVQKLLLPGEIARIAEIIMDLSGFNDNTVEYAKN